MGAQGTTCTTCLPSLLYEDKSVCKRVSVPTLLVELVSLVSLEFVSLIPLGSLVALSWLGDRVDFDLGVALPTLWSVGMLPPTPVSGEEGGGVRFGGGERGEGGSYPLPKRQTSLRFGEGKGRGVTQTPN